MLSGWAGVSFPKAHIASRPERWRVARENTSAPLLAGPKHLPGRSAKKDAREAGHIPLSRQVAVGGCAHGGGQADAVGEGAYGRDVVPVHTWFFNSYVRGIIFVTLVT